jgi:hypothetical protein
MLNQNAISQRAGARPRLSHQDESPAGYSLVGCSPAEPTSASPATLILHYLLPAGYSFSANGNCPQTRLSQLAAQATP